MLITAVIITAKKKKYKPQNQKPETSQMSNRRGQLIKLRPSHRTDSFAAV